MDIELMTLLAILIPIIVVPLLLCIICYIRYNCCGTGGYDRITLVHNGLDEEEIEFKRRVDGEFEDDLDNMDEEEEEYGFNSQDLDRLKMLEKYRNNLIAGASSNGSHHTGNNFDDNDVEGLRI